ncbi:MAG: hypothetical protein JXA93_06050 [Anaerolineae bacterium]|nr:hypothetical protein [Anaerolineae bacterium]
MDAVPRLTARQRVFLQKLVDLYHERQAPVHYSDVAEQIGVSPFSAYDMLKVLEKKGLASSSYALAAEHSGPGRSMVVFAPTAGVASVLRPLPQAVGPDDEWPGVRARVLNRLRAARDTSPREALSELLARLPETKSPLTYCTEMVGALLLNMQRARQRASGLNPFRVLAALRGDDSAELETLAGLSVGATLDVEEEGSSSTTQRLLEQMHRYQSNLGRLSKEARTMLVQFLEEALEALD